ncbi:inovirus Gp2 family protein [Marinobacterium zhoushanense]|nr:inovirus Gp2 family protein [Marinobacterium zhoushanense]
MLKKRVPNNHNLTLWAEPQYQGLNVNTNHDLVSEYLSKLWRVIDASVREYPRTFAVLVELHCDLPTQEIATCNMVMQDFKDELDALIADYMKRRAETGKRVYSSSVRWVWAREQKNSHVPHFHVLLLFNQDVFFELGEFHADSGSLMAMIRNAWYAALGIPPELKRGLIHVPLNAEYQLKPSNQYAALPGLFAHASYMCKAETKPFGQRLQCFGGSRN